MREKYRELQQAIPRMRRTRASNTQNLDSHSDLRLPNSNTGHKTMHSSRTQLFLFLSMLATLSAIIAPGRAVSRFSSGHSAAVRSAAGPVDPTWMSARNTSAPPAGGGCWTAPWEPVPLRIAELERLSHKCGSLFRDEIDGYLAGYAAKMLSNDGKHAVMDSNGWSTYQAIEVARQFGYSAGWNKDNSVTVSLHDALCRAARGNQVDYLPAEATALFPTAVEARTLVERILTKRGLTYAPRRIASNTDYYGGVAMSYIGEKQYGGAHFAEGPEWTDRSRRQIELAALHFHLGPKVAAAVDGNLAAAIQGILDQGGAAVELQCYIGEFAATKDVAMLYGYDVHVSPRHSTLMRLALSDAVTRALRGDEMEQFPPETLALFPSVTEARSVAKRVAYSKLSV
jgi:hypothetical protein